MISIVKTKNTASFATGTSILNVKEVCEGCGCTCPCDCTDCKECSECKDH